jgi:thiamine pyrophosphate-dependent acetolactate synthase large subunit-like protein
MIATSERPMIVASTGVFYAKAWDALKLVAEKNEIAVVESGASRGHFSDAHPLSASVAPDALLSADLVILIGQYCMPSIGEFAFGPDAKYIRVDPDPSDIGRNLPIDLGIVSDEKAALEALTEQLPKRKRPQWVAELASARKKFQEENDEYYRLGLKYSKDTELLHPAVIGRELAEFLQAKELPKEQTTIAMGGYGIARYVRRYVRAFRPGQICNGAYQYGAIGPDVGYTFGAAVAVQNGVGPQKAYQGAPVVGITGDAGFAYSGMELETFSKYKIPAVILLYNNNAWGVYTSGVRAPRALHMYLFQENLRYEKIAEALGGRGEYVTTPEDLRSALARSYKIAAEQRISTVINCQGKKEFWNNSEYPPGFVRNIEPGCMAYNH